ADYNYSELLMYALDYQGEGFAAGYVSDYEFSDMIGGIQTYMQDIYYNPFDGMLYWAYVGGTCEMVVMDLMSGGAVVTGVIRIVEFCQFFFRFILFILRFEFDDSNL
ncbi:MAG: hypothetical protein J6328_06405, partial [Bacilli bacterium]|nr:hypothetical protein [Bacilli bacterium]